MPTSASINSYIFIQKLEIYIWPIVHLYSYIHIFTMYMCYLKSAYLMNYINVFCYDNKTLDVSSECPQYIDVS